MKVKTVKHEMIALAEDGLSWTSRCGIWLRMDEIGERELLATKKEDITCNVCRELEQRLRMNFVTDKVLIGNASDAKNTKELLENGVSAVLNVAIDLQYSEYMHKDIVYRQFGLHDGPGNPTVNFKDAVNALFKLLEHGHTVMVHCHAGMSRSPIVVAAWYAKENNIPLPDAVDFVQSKRQIAFPHPELRKLAWEYVHGKGYVHG